MNFHKFKETSIENFGIFTQHRNFAVLNPKLLKEPETHVEGEVDECTLASFICGLGRQFVECSAMCSCCFVLSMIQKLNIFSIFNFLLLLGLLFSQTDHPKCLRKTMHNLLA